jgi:hypothetical protein
MAQAVPHHPLSAEAGLNPCPFHVRSVSSGRQWQWDRFLSEYISFLLSFSFHQCPILIFIVITLFIRRTSGRSLGTFKQRMLFKISGEKWNENDLPLFIYRLQREELIYDSDEGNFWT